ncbi:MAG: peptidoglycan DD-metalloendopeptidase family protein [Mariprofundaceae bacterium]
MMFRRLFIIHLLALGVLSCAMTVAETAAAQAASSAKQQTESRIEKIKLERARLAKIRRGLEKKLGALGRELRQLDKALVRARAASRKAGENVQQANRKLAELTRRKGHLKQQIAALEERLQDEAVAAWQRGSRSSQWLGILTGVSVSDIPHRRYLLNTVMHSQAEDRRQYQDSVLALRKVEQEMRKSRDELARLHEVKKKAERAVAERAEAKRRALNSVRQDVRNKKIRDARLAREQQALLDLLDNLGQGLLAMDAPQQAQHIRKRKGRLHWPLPGRIVASFGSRPSANRARLKGVQLKPSGKNHQVRAMAAGQVRYADWFGGYGLMTIVDYGDGVLGVYAHNDTLYQQLGDWVEEGDVLAEAGSTGWVSNVALYFEIRDKGKAVNPKRWCRR